MAIDQARLIELAKKDRAEGLNQDEQAEFNTLKGEGSSEDAKAMEKALGESLDKDGGKETPNGIPVPEERKPRP